MSYDFEKNYDVAVIGGGIAGIAAAVQAARSGMKTVLVEKTILLGGLATTGLVYVYLPLCDGNGRQVSFGITEELLRISLKYGPGDIPEHWRDPQSKSEPERFRVIFSPASFILAIDEMLEAAGVDVMLDTLVCAAEVTGNKITAAICENTSGRGRISARQFVDASGDCTLARRAGVACSDEYNFLSMWAIQHNEAYGGHELADKMQMLVQGVPWDVTKAPPEAVSRGNSNDTLTKFVLDSRRKLRKYYQDSYADPSGKFNRKNLFPVKLPAMPQFRKIYAIDAAYVLDSDQNNIRFEDSIGLVADWRKAGSVWEIPYRTLYPAKPIGGLLAAGRCIGSSNDAWEVTRVIPPAALTGQVAGLAAALCVKNNVEPYALDVALLQNELKNGCGFPLHLTDVGL